MTLKHKTVNSNNLRIDDRKKILIALQKSLSIKILSEPVYSRARQTNCFMVYR